MRLYAFGSNGNGQLGIGSDKDNAIPQPTHFSSIPHHNDLHHDAPPFLDFAAGGNHTALITRDEHQTLYMTGSNKDNETLLQQPVQIFTKVHPREFKREQSLEDGNKGIQKRQHRWRSVACGWAFTIAVTEPEPTLDLEDTTNTTPRHGRVVPTSRLYAWGSGSFGELGLGSTCTKTGPTALEIKAGSWARRLDEDDQIGTHMLDILKVRAGLRHVLLLTKEKIFKEGEEEPHRTRTVLMGWGSNRQGQLGVLERTSDRTVPLTEKDLRGKFMEPTRILISNISTSSSTNKGDVDTMEVQHEIVDMACGQSHSLVLFSDGSVYSSGLNKYGQLGPSSSMIETVDHPKQTKQQDFRIGFEKVQGLPFVDSISCGWNHNAAMDTRTLQGTGRTKIYLWGRNDHGQLGGGVPVMTVDPDLNGGSPVELGILQVRIPTATTATAGRYTEQDELEEIVSYSCGSEHTLAMTRSGDCYAWGWNEHGNCGSGAGDSNEDLKDVPTPRKVQFLETTSVNVSTATLAQGQRWVAGGYGSSWVWT
ncbi:regulator of chromosome condensation 1/beta-lactamase-inhibitor protein II [Gamsiella multidivaricata]|uniref:regulator of chromosome condensation 1/beta-lactamase-inhibitor protein II n=1 Tax=Gamsiella multidivaricata TaxID=101098 RepID=UPI002220A827|nr:regulator of chromosome condensation 1/beta-lactamase-inhibitor protein II [Gamsiella multidivaricata]KAG0351104.1 hypothetical protein BGZ54_003412 [Gamsiella multidivaricata]KAI7819857.1 regulator of chromosome condensation 1/beta-lactamase-inhibitor protein II [Gamsiella multidivaricata]